MAETNNLDILTLATVQQKILRNEEVCHLIVEGRTINSSGLKSKKTKFLVWIKNKQIPNESAILLVVKRKTSWLIRDAFLLTVELKINKKSNTLYDFISPSQILMSFDTTDSESMSLLIKALSLVPKTPRKPNDFLWSDFYISKKGKLLEISMDRLPELDPSEDSVLSNSPGSRASRASTFYIVQTDAAPLDVKDSWIVSQLKARENEFTETKTISVFCGTWNVNGKKPAESLQGWLVKDMPSAPDICALAFQELDLSAENFLLGSTPLELLWADHVANTLKSFGQKYVMLETKRMVGILLFVYIKEEHLSFIRSVQTGAATTGIMNMMGNKGGVAIRFNFRDSSFCFVNSHLNAHHENVERRNQDYHEIAKRVLFQANSGAPVMTIFDHDYLFWFGDLNYRLSMPDAEVREKLLKEDWTNMIEADQLKQQMKAGNAFEGFSEGPLLFAPTYKYDAGTNDYDTSEKHRTPAWCDRVLYIGKDCILQVYKRHELLMSDHKPVSASFEVKVKATIVDVKMKVYRDIVRHLDKLENESRPSAVMDKNHIDFGEMTYGVSKTLSLILENSGKVLAKFQFIPKLNELKYCKPWLSVTPAFGLLVPGEKVEIKFVITIDNINAPKFNEGKEKIEDILILHLNGGLDFFVTISGKYLPSSFGTCLSDLVRYPGAIRSSQPLPSDYPDLLSVPKELWRIVDYLYRKGLDEENLFMQTGTQSEVQRIRECLDNGEPFENPDIHSMAECLVTFLDSLAEPVVLLSLFPLIADCTTYEHSKQLIYSLPKIHYNVFFYIMSFLREVLQHSTKNKLTAEKLAVIFSSVLIRNVHGDKLPRALPPMDVLVRTKAIFVEQFLKERESV